MAVSRDLEPPLRGIDPVPDLGFRIVFGSYAGIVAIEALVAGAVWLGIGSEGVLVLAGLVVFGAAGLAGGVAIRRWRHGPERIGRSRLRHGFVLPGLPVLTVQVLALLAGAEDLFSPALLGTSLAATLFGAIVATMVRTRYVTALDSTSTPRVSWRAHRSWRSRLRTSLVFLPAAGVALVFEPGLVLPMLAGYLGSLVGPISGQTIAVHDAGLTVTQEFARRLLPWTQFDGYRLTDRELVLERPLRPDIGWRRTDIEDLQAVTDALDSQFEG